MTSLLGAAAATVVATCLLAACGGAGTDGSAPVPAASPSPAVSSSAPSSSSSESASPTVAPATGKTFPLAALEITMPAEGWRARRTSGTEVGAFQTAAFTLGSVIVTDGSNVGAADLAANAEVRLRTLNTTGAEVAAQPGRTVNGVEGWVIQGTDSPGRFFYEFGTVVGGRDVICDFSWSTDGDPRADPFAEMIEPVLASIVWK